MRGLGFYAMGCTEMNLETSVIIQKNTKCDAFFQISALWENASFLLHIFSFKARLSVCLVVL